MYICIFVEIYTYIYIYVVKRPGAAEKFSKVSPLLNLLY